MTTKWRNLGRCDGSRREQKQPEEPSLPPTNAAVPAAELQLARLIWDDIMASDKISVGRSGRWNRLTFDELMSLPEENPEGRGAAITCQGVQHRAASEATRPKELPETRPRLFVDDDLVWRTLTGHSEDLKRVPMMEWRLLVMIASTQEDGIIQGDLGRATNQDKRSVPRRTDFLCQKGYIAKRTHMVRGSKTSKLWLTQFAPELPAPSSDALNRAKALLTRDMEPVPWYHQWVNNKSKAGREEIHYQNLCQTIVGIIKAWGALRIRDLKRKLGISGLKWQMKIMSKFLRRFEKQGCMAYAAAKFPGNSFVFKDCVKFIRDPTDQDWRDLLATGKKIKKKSKGKGAKAKSKGKTKGKGKASALSRPVVRVLNKRRRNPPRPAESLWEPGKPIANTIADFLISGADEGYTTSELSDAIATRQFRRYLSDHLKQNCALGVQPPNLGEYQMSSDLTKTSKGPKQLLARTYICAGPSKSETGQDVPEESAIDPALSKSEPEGTVLDDPFGFAPFEPSALQGGDISLTSLCEIPEKPAKTKRPYKRRQTATTPGDSAATVAQGDAENAAEKISEEEHNVEIAAASSESSTAKRRRQKGNAEPGPEGSIVETATTAADATPVRPSRKRKAAQRVSYLDPLEGNIELDTSDAEGRIRVSSKTSAKNDSTSAQKSSEYHSGEESEAEQDRSKPGVYEGIPGSLNPDLRKKGRPRKSIVLIFRSDKLKNPDHLPGWTEYARPSSEAQPSKSMSKPRGRPPRTTKALAEQETPIQTPRSQHEDLTQNEASAIAGPEDPRQTLPERTSSKPEEGTIVVCGPTIEVRTSGEEENSSIDAKVQPAAQPISPTATEPQSLKGQWNCPTCGYQFAGSNGLQYHLTKGRNMCNPVFAENPDLMARRKPGRRSKLAESEEYAQPGNESGSESSDQGSNAKNEPPARSFRTPAKKGMASKQKRAAPLRRIDSNDPDGLTIQRSRVVLQQRSDLKSRGIGASSLGTKPRGVEASEAAAKEAASAKSTELPTDGAISVTESITAKGQQGTVSAGEDEEDLPYIDFIRSKAATVNAVSMSQASEETGHVPAEETSVYKATFGTSTISSDYPVEVLEPSQQVIAAREATDFTTPEPTPSRAKSRKAQPSKRIGNSNRTVDGSVSSFRMDAKSVATRDSHTEEGIRALRTDRICQIVKYLVTNSGGVFPGDRALHWAVLKIYLATFPGPDGPTLAGCSRGVSLLSKDGILKTVTVALRAHGLWKSLKLILLADMDPNGTEVQSFKNKAKEAEVPEMYIPPPFDPTESEKIRIQELEKPSRQRGKGLGRRDGKLAEGISQLNAPYYARTGMAGVRPGVKTGRRGAESSGEEDVGTPPKRRRKQSTNADIIRRRKRKGEVDENWSPARKRGRKSAADDYAIFVVEPHKLSIDGSHAANPGISSLPASFFSSTPVPDAVGYSAPSAIQFLEPNTLLDDDFVPALEPELEPEPEPAPEPEPEPVIEIEDESSNANDLQAQEAELVVRPGTHADTFEIKASKDDKGVWPNRPLTWWERKGGSFTMKGWMPDNTEQLMENIPRTMEQMAFKITSHCKPQQWADPHYGVFCTSVDGCRSYEQSDAGIRALSGTVGTNYLWINFSAVPEVSSMAPVEPRWLDENEWTLQTIPYEMLESDDENLDLKLDALPQATIVQKRRPGRPRMKEREPKPPSRKYVRKQDRDPNLRELKLQRELTPYPREPSDYFRAKGQDCLGVDWKAEDTRIAAYVAVSTLVGGINKAMDWGLMMRIFPESKLSNLRKFWSMIRKERDGFINTLTSKFQEDFLEAYEKGDLPPFDFDRPLEYDWPLLVKWTLALVVREGIELPPNRPQFDDELELVLVDKNDFDWRETYHHWQRSVFNKFQDSTSEPASTAIDVKQATETNDAIIARSWVRALCCTESNQYTPYKIRDKFLELTRGGQRSDKEVSDLLEATIFDLEHRRIAIKQKSSALATGRPYKLNEHFCRTLDRYSNEDKFTVAAEFKSKLDAAFRDGEAVEIPWRTEDGMVLAAFNMQAAGRVTIEPVPSRKLDIPFGFKPGFYESRKFPKSYYRFDLQIVPTSTYIYNEDIDVLWRATAPDNIPAATEDGKLPMWCDFFGRPSRHRWFKMLAGVMFMLSTRGAMTDEFTAQSLKPCFEQFEVEIVRKWGLKEGLLREITVSGGAVSVTEWWWLVIGTAMLELSADDAEEGEQRDASGGRRTKDQYAEWASGRSRRRGKYRVIQ